MMKQAAKLVARLLALLLATPFLVAFYVSAPFLGHDQALEHTIQWLALWPGLVGSYVRGAFLRQTLAQADAECRVSFGTLLSKCDAEIHRHAYVGPRCCLGLVTLEEDVLLGPGVQIPSGGHIHGTDSRDETIRTQQGSIKRVRIGRGAWVGAGAIVMADVGEETIVGAGSVVTKPLPPCVVAAGVPARIIRHRDENPSSHPTHLQTKEDASKTVALHVG